MASEVSAALRRSVIERAKGACEYCQLHQDFSIYTHEVDHVTATKHGGKTILENLALACLPCNRRKGSDLTSFDPETGKSPDCLTRDRRSGQSISRSSRAAFWD
jgi:5-methylcytosine-specific restriction endonuclease McrA